MASCNGLAGQKTHIAIIRFMAKRFPISRYTARRLGAGLAAAWSLWTMGAVPAFPAPPPTRVVHPKEIQRQGVEAAETSSPQGAPDRHDGGVGDLDAEGRDDPEAARPSPDATLSGAAATDTSAPGASTSGTSTSDGGAAFVFHDTTDVRWVLVPTVVRGPGGPIHDLDAEDFEIWVDQRRVSIESFDARSDGALRLIFLQDLSGSMDTAGKLDLGRLAARELLRSLRADDELTLASFASGRVQVDARSDTGEGTLRRAVDAWNAWGTTALHDAVAMLPEIDLLTRDRGGAAILVTDGGDNASALGAERARDLVRRSDVPVYVLAVGADPGDPAPDDPLGRLARDTGGRYYSVRTPTHAVLACQRITAELRGQYVLGFSTAGAADARAIRVETRPGLEVRHRLAYHGGPPTGGPDPL